MAVPPIAAVPSRPSVATLARAGLLIAAVLAIATVAVAIVEGAAGDELDGSPIYLVAVVIVATRLRTAAGIVTAIAAFVIYNLLFTEPRFTLVVSDPTEWLNLVLFLFVALVIGRLAGIGADRAAEAEARAEESAAAVRDHPHPRDGRPGYRAPGGRPEPRDRRRHGSRLVRPRRGWRGTHGRRHGRRADRCRAGDGPGPDGRPRRARLDADARPACRRRATPGRWRRAPGPTASTGTRSVSKPTARCSAPCGGRATPITRSHRAPRPASSPSPPRRSASRSAGSGSVSRPSWPRSRVATPPSRARSSIPSRTTCARRSPASGPPRARSPIPPTSAPRTRFARRPR